MKKTIMIICLLQFIGCANSIKINEIEYILKEGTDYHVLDNNTYLFPSLNNKSTIFNQPVTLDSDYEHVINSEGQIIDGKLGDIFEGSNNQASFIIPIGTVFKFREEFNEYVFELNADVGSIKCEYIEYNINQYINIDSKLNFHSNVKDDVEFYKDNKKIIFLRNDSTPWLIDEEFDYDYFSEDYRNEIEADILKNINMVQISDLEKWFESPDRPGLHNFRGKSYEVEIDTTETKVELEEITNEKIFDDCFRNIRMNRPYKDTYENILSIPLKIKHFDKMKSGILELIVPVNEVNNIQRIINENKKLHIVLRLGIFSDFSVTGSGILYFSYDIEQKNLLLRNY
ncbi:MAG: hypothetical protein GY756_19505 [bacterium]|nr:hypothetical protein [bacterium]